MRDLPLTISFHNETDPILSLDLPEDVIRITGCYPCIHDREIWPVFVYLLFGDTSGSSELQSRERAAGMILHDTILSDNGCYFNKDVLQFKWYVFENASISAYFIQFQCIRFRGGICSTRCIGTVRPTLLGS